MSLLGGLAAAIRAGLRPIVLCGVVGLFAGFAWGLADEPVYSASATVVISDRGDAADSVGGGVVGGSESESAERLLELARSDAVAKLAAESLGGDVNGADLLARTTFGPGPDGATLVVRSTASFPDFAAAAANAYASAVVEEAGSTEKKRLERLEEGLQEELALVDPASEEGAALTERLEAIDTLAAAGDPLTAGAPAQLPSAPASDRSASRFGLLGLCAGVLLALLVLCAGELRRRPIRTATQVAAVAAGGSEPLGLLGPGDGAVRSRRPGVYEIDPLSADRAQRIERALGLDRAGAPATLTVASPMPGEGRTSVALGLAASAAADGLSVLLVETDMRRPALAVLLGIESGPGLSDYLAGAATPREVIAAIPVARGDASGELPSFVCVTAGTRTESPGAMLSSTRFRSLIDQLQRVYDLVIFDSPALLPAPEAILVSEATEATVLCVRSGVTRSRELAEAETALAGIEVAGIVLTGARHRGAATRRLPIARGSRFAEPPVRR